MTINEDLTHRDNYMTFIMYYSTENIHINMLVYEIEDINYTYTQYINNTTTY